MVELIVKILAIVILFIIAMLIEESRDWLIDTFEYLISFEWWEDMGEAISTIWEGLSEFSVYGVVFGILTTLTLYFLSDWTLQPFLQYYDSTGKVVWTIVTYVGTFAAGYSMGVFFENS